MSVNRKGKKPRKTQPAQSATLDISHVGVLEDRLKENYQIQDVLLDYIRKCPAGQRGQLLGPTRELLEITELVLRLLLSRDLDKDQANMVLDLVRAVLPDHLVSIESIRPGMSAEERSMAVAAILRAREFPFKDSRDLLILQIDRTLTPEILEDAKAFIKERGYAV